MISVSKTLKLAVPALLAGTVAVSATTLDFTGAGWEAGSIGTNGWTLTGAPGAALEGDAIDSPATNAAVAAAGLDLALEFDGIGVDSNTSTDEVDGTDTLTLSFDRKVKITGVYFLDLYFTLDDAGAIEDLEQAGITNGAATEIVDAQRRYRIAGGFGEASMKMTGDTFTFFDPSGGNDAVGVGDFALAAVTVAPIPLPAGFLLLGTALGGLGVARRFKKA